MGGLPAGITLASATVDPSRPLTRTRDEPLLHSMALPGNMRRLRVFRGNPPGAYRGGGLDGWRWPATVADDVMRKNLIKKGDEHLRYEIREIVEIANEIVR